MSETKVEKFFVEDEKPAEPPAAAMVQVAQSRAIQEVQGAIISAKKFPRDENKAFSNIIKACKRKTLAETAIYTYPRGGKTVSGPSVQLAKVIAQAWGNIDFGIREIERKAGSSLAESYCIDLENNVRQSVTFEVPHELTVGQGVQKTVRKLTDPRDVYEIVANNGSRRLRACILGIIPGDVVEAAVTQCRKTLAGNEKEPLSDRIRKVVHIFAEIGVDQDMLSAYLGHAVDQCNAEEIVDLVGIFNTLKDGNAKRSQFFDTRDADARDADVVAAKLRENSMGGEK